MIAAWLGRPASTVRGWLRAFAASAGPIAEVFTALSHVTARTLPGSGLPGTGTGRAGAGRGDGIRGACSRPGFPSPPWRGNRQGSPLRVRSSSAPADGRTGSNTSWPLCPASRAARVGGAPADPAGAIVS